MKNQIRILAALTMIAALAIPYGCKDDDDPAAPLELSTVTVGGADLNGTTSPVGVATDASMDVTFTTNVDPATATAANIKLMRDYDDVDIPVTITPDPTNAAKINIKPNDNLSSGNLYKLTLGAGLMSDRGQAFTEQSRTFTTAGFFALSDQAAHWSFESNGDDEFGNYNADSDVDITYVDGRNAAAGKAASFNGTTSIMEVADGDDFMDSKSMSVSLWVKPDATNTHGHFVLGVAGFLGFQYEIAQDMTSSKFVAQYERSDAATQAEETWWNGEGLKPDSWVGWTFSKDIGGPDGVKAIFTDKWVHVITTYDAATRVGTMYLDGEKVKSWDFNLYPDADLRKASPGLKYGGKAAPGNNLAFGFTQSSSMENRSLGDTWAAYENVDNNHFKGQLDDVRIFKRALSSSEVTLIYQSEK